MNPADGDNYTSNSQKIRKISECWTEKEIFCPACGAALERSPNNSKVLDFLCKSCPEEYELKSGEGKIARKVNDGAFASMMSRIVEPNSPHFFFMSYHRLDCRVDNFFVVPSYFFQSKVIEKRKPLAPTARRAGWVGCFILLDQIPELGKIHYVRNGCEIKPECVLNDWQKTRFLRESASIESRSWTLDVLSCIEKIKQPEFVLEDVYQFETKLALLHPKNNFVKDKIRQQLQVLRDKGLLEFVSRGRYRMVGNI